MAEVIKRIYNDLGLADIKAGPPEETVTVDYRGSIENYKIKDVLSSGLCDSIDCVVFGFKYDPEASLSVCPKTNSYEAIGFRIKDQKIVEDSVKRILENKVV